MASDRSSASSASPAVVIVTGGARGIGRAIAERFLENGAHVVVCGRTPPPAPIGEAVFVEADVREPEAAERVVQAAVERFGRLDVLVNNAGGSPFAEAATASPRFSTAIVALNLLAPLHFAQRANAAMQAQDEGGVIVNVASVSGTRASPGTAAYGAAKAGLLNLTQSLAVEWAPKVRVNAVTPGLVRTEQSHLHYGDEAGIAAVSATVPLGRMAEPRDVAEACFYLASPAARYVSGANLLVHGGGERPAFLAAANARHG
jgi:NAD(P)-dependent dehydrogenase (short-subunit alcohol dehydrogenase family)